MPFNIERVPWGRWMAEFLLILVSVYLAVFLESSNQARSERAAARQALGQLLGELKEDQADFARIIQAQEELNQTYLNVGRWLRDPESYPVDSVAAALNRIATENPTLFARRASWNTMISGGQLAALDAPALVLRLGQLYETIYARIDYNSRYYDEDLLAVMRSTRAVRWNELQTRPLVDDPAEIEQLVRMLSRIHTGWNVWYRDLLMGYQDDVQEGISAVEAYLGADGV